MSSKEPINRRKKARRSCLKCQKSHKTCGNERPCKQCLKRGIPLSCVDGIRKLPKYMCDSSVKDITGQLYPTTPYPQAIQFQQYLDIEITSRHKYNHSEPSWKENLHEHRRQSLGNDPLEFVNPQVLHNSFTYTDLRGSCKLGAPLESGYDEADFSKKLHNIPLSISDTPDRSVENDIPDSSSGQMFRDDLGQSSTRAVISTSNIDGSDYDYEDSSGGMNHSTMNFGFAIKSGWSSTFFI